MDHTTNTAASVTSRKSSKHKSSRRKTTSLSAEQMHLSPPPNATPTLVTSPSLGIIHSGSNSTHKHHRRRPLDSKSDGGLPRNNSDKSVKTTTSRNNDVELEVQVNFLLFLILKRIVYCRYFEKYDKRHMMSRFKITFNRPINNYLNKIKMKILTRLTNVYLYC